MRWFRKGSFFFFCSWTFWHGTEQKSNLHLAPNHWCESNLWFMIFRCLPEVTDNIHLRRDRILSAYWAASAVGIEFWKVPISTVHSLNASLFCLYAWLSRSRQNHPQVEIIWNLEANRSPPSNIRHLSRHLSNKVVPAWNIHASNMRHCRVTAKLSRSFQNSILMPITSEAAAKRTCEKSLRGVVRWVSDVTSTNPLSFQRKKHVNRFDILRHMLSF